MLRRVDDEIVTLILGGTSATCFAIWAFGPYGMFVGIPCFALLVWRRPRILLRMALAAGVLEVAFSPEDDA